MEEDDSSEKKHKKKRRKSSTPPPTTEKIPSGTPEEGNYIRSSIPDVDKF